MTLKLDLIGTTQIRVTRSFAAPPTAVFNAHVQPDLIRQWMTGPDGWAMPHCDHDTQPGGDFRMVWVGPDGFEFSITGTYIALEAPNRIEHVERMHMPDATPDNHIVTEFAAQGDGTLMTMTMTLPDEKARDEVIATGMEGGMEDSYARIDALL